MNTPPGQFEFWKVSYLKEVTHLRASSLGQLLTGVTLAPDWSIFFHFHDCFFRDASRFPEYPNDFATWTHESLGEDIIAERLANVNLARSISLTELRRELSVILAEHLLTDSGRTVRPGADFVFCKPRLIAFANGQFAKTPTEFARVLREVDSESIGYHLFFAPRITEEVSNDFSVWFRQWGYSSLARQIESFDPYVNSLEGNREYLAAMIEKGIEEGEAGHA